MLTHQKRNSEYSRGTYGIDLSDVEGAVRPGAARLLDHGLRQSPPQRANFIACFRMILRPEHQRLVEFSFHNLAIRATYES
jgi:hypothetical protein